MRRFLIGLALVGLALLVWRLADVILLVFGAALVAVILRAIADPVARSTALSSRLALLAAVLFVLGLMGLAGWLFGSELAAQASTLDETIPAAWRSFEARLVGLPSALMLGLIAGLAEFVPLLGPILSAVPGLLLALVDGPATALWALGVYLLVQQIESNLVTPLVEKKAVSIPPVVTLFGVLSLGVTFGVLGVLLAGPLTVALYVLVKQLYVRDTLGEEAQIPGEPTR